MHLHPQPTVAKRKKEMDKEPSDREILDKTLEPKRETFRERKNLERDYIDQATSLKPSRKKGLFHVALVWTREQYKTSSRNRLTNQPVVVLTIRFNDFESSKKLKLQLNQHS